MGRKLIQSEVIKRFNEKHNNKYDYSFVDYINTSTKVKIICPNHGMFSQTPNGHFSRGCQKCYFDSLNSNSGEFIKKCIKIHGNKYDYSLVCYLNSKKKVKILCKKHGIFYQEPRNHLVGQRCPVCVGNKKITNKDFIKRANEIHKKRYDYSLVKVNGSREKVKIICKSHGIFKQVVDTHLRNHGCPKCRNSKGESLISWFLDKKIFILRHKKHLMDV